MLATQIKRLAAVRAKVAHLEKAVAGSLRLELKDLQKRYGFADADTFIRAVTTAVIGLDLRSRGVNLKRKRRRRSIITKAMRAAVTNMSRTGKVEAEIARVIGISVASVHSIRKSAGLVKPRE